MLRVGVLAMQGAFIEHIEMLKRCGVKAIEVRLPEELAKVQALILPGGESTSNRKLLKESNLLEPLAERIKQGMPVFGTCAGAILLAKTVDSRPGVFQAIDISVKRNAYGRQVDSFEAELKVKGFAKPFHGVFIRAPIIEHTGKNVEVLSEFGGKVVLAKQNNVLVATFHPELTEDARIHRLFLAMVK
jgi:5'-phosphate synthase pdxT subunit